MKLPSYISTLIALILISSLAGCDSSDNGLSGFSINDREIVPFDEDIEVWLAEETNPEYSNDPQLYLSLKPGRMYTDGYDIYATYHMAASRIEIEIYGMLSPQEGMVYPAVMIWPDIAFPLGELNGHYDLFLNYGDLTDVYGVEVSGETISLFPIETNFSRKP